MERRVQHSCKKLKVAPKTFRISSCEGKKQQDHIKTLDKGNKQSNSRTLNKNRSSLKVTLKLAQKEEGLRKRSNKILLVRLKWRSRFLGLEFPTVLLRFKMARVSFFKTVPKMEA